MQRATECFRLLLERVMPSEQSPSWAICNSRFAVHCDVIRRETVQAREQLTSKLKTGRPGPEHALLLSKFEEVNLGTALSSCCQGFKGGFKG